MKKSLCLLNLCVWLGFISVCSVMASSPSEIKQIFPKLKVDQSIFNSPGPSSQVKIIPSQYHDQPEGVGITYQLDPDKRYLMSITGQSYGIKPVLGIRIVGTPDRKLAAPNGEIFINIFNTREVILFLNIHPKMKYHLSSIQFRECPQCVNQKELIQRIQKENPQLEVLLKRDPLLASQLILDWAANVTPIALSKPLRDKTDNLNRMSSEEIYNLFNSNLAAVYCGGSSVFLNKVFALFGIYSFAVDFGDIKNSLTHVTVMVAKPSSGSFNYYVFDPLFNFTFQNPENSNFMTFSELLDLPPTGIEDKIKINQQSLHKRKFLALKKDLKKCHTVKETTQDSFSCSIPDYSLKRHLDKISPVYAKNGYTRNLSGFLQLLRNRIFSIRNFSKKSIPNLSEHNIRIQFMNLLKTHKIPLGYNP
ncbi:MAG: hypothetical protein OEM27_06900 [Nitrospinota bacterium]|nr:hypothetical protein [Nitrospinota bacterium]